MNKVFIYSNGCIENLVDDNRLREYFCKNNWSIVDNSQEADLILMNICGNGAQVREDFRTKLKNFQQLENKTIIVAGCLAPMDPVFVKQVFSGPTIGPREWDRLDALIKPKVGISKIEGNIADKKGWSSGLRKPWFLPRAGVALAELVGWLDSHMGTNIRHFFRRVAGTWFDTTMFYIKIGVGCMGKCSFCAVKHAKGGPMSKPVSAIVQEFQHGLCQGYKEFVLSADDAGSYGRDIGTNLQQMLAEILKHDESYGIHIRYIEPERFVEMFDELWNIFKTRRILSVCSSVQSGSNQVLMRMNKEPKVEEWIRCIRVLNKELPSLRIRTQIIVGFPGETEEEFSDTLKLVDELEFDSLGVYMYENIPNTTAANFPDQVSDSVKKARKRRLVWRWMLNKYLYRRRATIQSEQLLIEYPCKND